VLPGARRLWFVLGFSELLECGIRGGRGLALDVFFSRYVMFGLRTQVHPPLKRPSAEEFELQFFSVSKILQTWGCQSDLTID